ncbi:MAG: HAD-IIIC family phosphatase, partial [Pseudomonadota bacterium]
MTKGVSTSEEERAPIALAASFTLGPVTDFLASLANALAWPAAIRAVPYGRFAAQLSDGGGAFWAPASLRMILMRPIDLGDDLAVARDLIVQAVRDHDDGAPLHIIVGHEDAQAERGFGEDIRHALSKSDYIDIVCASDLFVAQSVTDTFDDLTNKTGHLPYTEEGMVVLGLHLAREADKRLRPPLKLIAVDGDHTLWQGVLGEDGIDGITLKEGHHALQVRLKEAAGRGVILALLTKNEDRDIRALFDQRSDFPLDISDFLAIEAGWQEKSQALSRIAASHGVGQDAILFLDDSPVECARLQEALPGVLTIRVPEVGPATSFLDALWLLDWQTATADDEKRVARLRQEAVRRQARTESSNLVSFFDTLGLEIDVFTPDREEIVRLAQLSQRTNQFNSTLLRLTETDLVSRSRAPDSILRGVRVRDRFGDYGIVGLVVGQVTDDQLTLDLLCLSCRVLGRGVEHHLVRQVAKETDASSLLIRHITAPRNAPFRQFLAHLSGQKLPPEGQVELSAEAVKSLEFDPAQEADASEAVLAPVTSDKLGRGETYERIAWAAHDNTLPLDLFRSPRDRESIDIAFSPARGPQEQKLAGIWQDVLGVSRIGRDDPFTVLGGKSLHLVRIHARLVREMGIDLPMADLFRFSTIADLTAHLAGPKTAV